MQRHQLVICSVALFGLCGCISKTGSSLALEEMEAFAICQNSEVGETIANKIRAEYGFKKFAENTYRPVVEQRLFGHKVRVVEMSEESNKVYASGEPLEFAYNFKKILPDIFCEKDTCQAPLPNAESLLIYKAKFKKIKDTSFIECTKPLQPEAE